MNSGGSKPIPYGGRYSDDGGRAGWSAANSRTRGYSGSDSPKTSSSYQDQKAQAYYGGRYSSPITTGPVGRSNPSGPRKRASSYSDKVVTVTSSSKQNQAEGKSKPVTRAELNKTSEPLKSEQ